jgi:sec-independent protein translocase protein TatC
MIKNREEDKTENNSFFDGIKPHLYELRDRLKVIVGTLLVLFIIAFVFRDPILVWVTQPLNDALASVGGNLHNLASDGKVTTHQVGGAFFVALKIAFFASVLFGIPVILWQTWLFVAPGLYAHEKKYLYPFIAGGTFMFFLGALFAYYIVTPYGFEFLIAFGSENFTPYINIEDYIGFFGKIMIGFGFAFELPIFILFFAMMGLVTDKTLKDFFKYAILIIFVVAAILTPPDVITQFLMAVPLVLLYLISIWIAKFINPHKEEDEEN